MLVVSAEGFCRVAGLSGRVWVLWGSWGILGGAVLCHGIGVSGRGAGGRNGAVLWLVRMLWVLWMLGKLWVLGILWVLEVLWVLGLGPPRAYDRPASLPTAPEVVKGDPVGSAADVWGVGVLTYIM